MTKPTRGGGLRAGDIAPPKLTLVEEFPADERRKLVTSATVKLVNNCGVDAYIGIKYTGSNGNYVYTWPFIGKGSSVTLKGVTKSTIFIYGVKASDVTQSVWQSSNNNGHCFASGDCLDARNVGSLASGFVTYRLCGTGALTAKDTQWLNGHNSRRAKWFSQNGKSRLDLKWSNRIKQSAQQYANKLIAIGGSSDCQIQHGYQGDDYGGENLAANWGPVSSTPDEVMKGWYEDEISLSFGNNLHATQMVFRSTHYVGCGVASKTLKDGNKCFIHVCRYISPGNCNMYQNGWRARTLDDTVICGPKCPPEGCF